MNFVSLYILRHIFTFSKIIIITTLQHARFFASVSVIRARAQFRLD